MRILVTNDDGVYSPGIAALAQVASRFGEVRIVAPDVEMSSASHAITASRPVTYKKTPLAGLQSSHGVLQTRVNRELHLKRTPQLTFQYDPTVERGARLSRLIDELTPDEHDDNE